MHEESPCKSLVHTNEKFEYFIKRTEKDLDTINKKLDKLMNFRWMLIGGTFVITFFVNLIWGVIKGS